MRKITAKKFIHKTTKDPAWASKLTADVEITDYCDMRGSSITHLSKYLHFKGDLRGVCACFWGCINLKKAEGIYYGHVSFAFSGIEEVSPEMRAGHSKVLARMARETGKKVDKTADFADCPKLKKIPITFLPKDILADDLVMERLLTDHALAMIQKNKEQEIEL